MISHRHRWETHFCSDSQYWSKPVSFSTSSFNEYLIKYCLQIILGPYELFVRELVAIDGADQSEILLIDSLGCPTDLLIMGSMNKADGNGQVLEAKFDAFKFPTSDVVQFKAVVAPCLPACDPIKCSVSGMDGRTSEVHSFGRRRRKRNAEEVLVVQSLSVSDKFGFQRSQRKLDLNEEHESVAKQSNGLHSRV